MPTLTLTLNTPAATRVANALGRHLNLKEELTPEIQADPDADPPVLYQPATYGPRPATMAEAKDYVRSELKKLVVRCEYDEKQKALTYDPEPTID